MSGRVEITTRMPLWIAPWWNAMLEEKAMIPNAVEQSFDEGMETECQTFCFNEGEGMEQWLKIDIAWLIRIGSPNVVSVKTSSTERTQKNINEIIENVGFSMFHLAEKGFGRKTGDDTAGDVIVSGTWMALEGKLPFSTAAFDGWCEENVIKKFGRLLSKHSSRKVEEKHVAGEERVGVNFSAMIREACADEKTEKVFSLGDAIGGSILQWLKVYQDNERPLQKEDIRQMISAWLKHGGSLKKRNRSNGNSLLHTFMYWGKNEYEMSEVVRQAIENGADIELRNAKDKTALDMASINRKGMLLDSFWGEHGNVHNWRQAMQSIALKHTTQLSEAQSGKTRKAL